MIPLHKFQKTKTVSLDDGIRIPVSEVEKILGKSKFQKVSKKLKDEINKEIKKNKNENSRIGSEIKKIYPPEAHVSFTADFKGIVIDLYVDVVDKTGHIMTSSYIIEFKKGKEFFNKSGWDG